MKIDVPQYAGAFAIGAVVLLFVMRRGLKGAFSINAGVNV